MSQFTPHTPQHTVLKHTMLNDLQKRGLTTTFLGACAHGDIERASNLLTTSPSIIHDVLPDGSNALHLAVTSGHTTIVQLLLTHGLSADARQQSGLTPLHIAAHGGWWRSAHALLIAGHAAINAIDKMGMTALHHAAAAGRVYMVDKLAASGASLETRDRNGHTPLWSAVRFGQLMVVSVLLSRGAKVNRPDHRLATPLHVAARYGFVDVAEMLLAAGANKEAWNDDGRPPRGLLDAAASWNMVRLLQ